MKSSYTTPLALGLLALATAASASTDYGPAIWRPACSGKWYSSAYHRFFVIHDMEGYYGTCISMNANCNIGMSCTYSVKGKRQSPSSGYPDGEISQHVRVAYGPWHARCWNKYSGGTEHEGFRSNPVWWTDALYSSSAGATKAYCNKYGIAKDKNHIVGHDAKKSSAWCTYAENNLGIDAHCNTHSDPGPYWNWTKYMGYINGTSSTPSAPSNLALTVLSASQIKVVWVDHSGIETGFKVERATASGGPFTQIATTGANVLTYTAGSLTSGTAYYFRVRAYNAAGNSSYSNTAGATTKDTIPAAPTSLTATAASDVQINLAWAQAMANEDGFRIYRSTDGTNFTQIATAAINATTYNNTGLAGNRQYWYKVCAYNTAGNSAFTAVATDITAPQAPTGLTAASAGATDTTWNKINLAWTDNAASEVGFKVERGTAAAGPFTQIATTASGAATYQDSGLSSQVTYYYRVRSYNGNGNSAYSSTASAVTPNAPPSLAAIGDKTVMANNALAFTATATDPNKVVTTPWIGTWEGQAHGDAEIVFRKPINSGTTAGFINTSATNYTIVVTNAPTGRGGAKALKMGWTFKTGTTNPWIRLTTASAPVIPNLTIGLDQQIQFKIYSTKALKVGLGVRETSTTAAYAADGGLTGSLEWVGVTNVVNSNPFANKYLTASNWQTLVFNIPFEPQWSFTGDGKVLQTGAKGVLEHIILKGEGGTGAYTVYVDDLAIVLQNTLAYTLDAGAPSGAAIERRTGKFTWTPNSSQAGLWPITVRVTDQGGAQDFETIKVTVTGVGNSSPNLAAIGAKSVNEGVALTFTATATDPDPGTVLTYSLDAGAPAGATINSTSGAFSWTPTESQGGSSFPITVRVTDNGFSGYPATNDFETITVTVKDVNAAPALAAIAPQSVTEFQTFSYTCTASDSDLPAQTVSYSLLNSPAGMTINAATGAIAWTPGESDGPSVVSVTVRATDNGTPALYSQQTFALTVNEANTAPVLTVASTVTTITNVVDLEDMEEGGINGTVLFRQPSFSSTTIGFLDAAVTNETTVESVFPEGNISSKAMLIAMSFKTGTTNPWCRLSTYGASLNPNPTIDFTKRLVLDFWTSKSVKLGLICRETGTGAELGANGGTTGNCEYVGVTNVVSGSPDPNRVIAASNWVSLEFDLPSEPCRSFTGNGALAAAKGVLESLIIKPNAGMGTYIMYFDNIQVKNVSSNFVVNTFETLTLSNTAADVDVPLQNLAFSLGAGAPTNAAIDDYTGVFTWTPTPEQSPSTNLVPIVVTDDGPGALSDTKYVQIIVNKVNTTPILSGLPETAIETNSGSTITFNAEATDNDIPADALTFSLLNAPAGATIDPVTGLFSWTPSIQFSTNVMQVRVTDNGVPSLYDEKDLIIIVRPTNTPPNLTLPVAMVTEMVVNYESVTVYTNEGVMFKKPANSTTTSNHVNTAVANTCNVTNASIPAGNTNGGTKALRAAWTFKTGTTNPWIRLNTYNLPILKNPTFDFTGKIRFSIYSTKSLKVALGLRETGTAANVGADGGATGTIEWVGATNKTANGCPLATRTVNASNWTTLEFDLQAEPCTAFTGNGVLTNAGKGVLESLALVANGGTGAYTVYVDAFRQIYKKPLTNLVVMPAGATLSFQAAASDIDTPAQALSFLIDADAHTNATINAATGQFSWTPTTADVGTTNPITVMVEDDPTNGAVAKATAKTFNVSVVADALAPVSVDSDVVGSVVEGEQIRLTWDSIPGLKYRVQYKDGLAGEWLDVMELTAVAAVTEVDVEGGGLYRVVAVEESALAE